MAGGRFISMNKIRPGAYINFEASPVSRITVGDRGVATMLLPLSWGPEEEIIEVTGEDMITGNSLAKIGLLVNDAAALPINLALKNCSTVKVFNANSGGTEASAVLGSVDISYILTEDTAIVEGKTYYTRSGTGTEQDPYEYTAVVSPDVSDIGTYYERVETTPLSVEAKYPGEFGNSIAMLIREIDDKFSVETYANGYAVDTQRVSTAAELKDNAYVKFTSGPITAISSTLLTGGADGTPASNYLQTYFSALRLTYWNVLAYTLDSDIDSVVEFIRTMREDEGKYVQAVVANYDNADYEGIINNVNGVVLDDGTQVSAVQFTSWVAGASAGALITESITGKLVQNATGIIGLMTNNEIAEGLTQGKFILSFNQDGSIKVEKDINSLHTFTIDKNYTFSKNRVIRELDEIGASIENIWETTYLGKVSNNEDGRTLFKSSIINYLTELENRGAIQDFDADRVEVIAGEDIDSVIANIAIKPVDSMEFLYLTINVEQ